ncbi:MAG: HlyC/CorC family transporter [Myxococcales bacterium]|nr:HlyC/CorC family transporter [Myxococcales bacterium]
MTTSIVLIIICLILSAFFSGSETALLRLREADLAPEDPERPGPVAASIRELLASTSRLLVTILLGNNVVNILGASLASAVAVAAFGPEMGVLIATVAMTILILVFCEILPKTIAATHPSGVSRIVGLPLYILHQLLRPIHVIMDRVVEPLVRKLAGAADDHTTAENVLRMARDARLGLDAGDPLAIMGAAANASERTAEEIMIERPDIFAFSIATPSDELLERVLDERYTRVPIFEDTIDTVLGFVHLKDLTKLERSGDGTLRDIVKPVLRVPERKPILELLANMQKSFIHLAIVKDENGLTQGMLTQEDILEEIVGEIRDEFDREELQAIIRHDGEFEALGRVKVLDFNRETDWELPAEPGDTLSGLVFNSLGRAPRKGDTVEVGDFQVIVVDVSGTRIPRVRVRGKDR